VHKRPKKNITLFLLLIVTVLVRLGGSLASSKATLELGVERLTGTNVLLESLAVAVLAALVAGLALLVATERAGLLGKSLLLEGGGDDVGGEVEEATEVLDALFFYSKWVTFDSVCGGRASYVSGQVVVVVLPVELLSDKATRLEGLASTDDLCCSAKTREIEGRLCCDFQFKQGFNIKHQQQQQQQQQQDRRKQTQRQVV